MNYDLRVQVNPRWDVAIVEMALSSLPSSLWCRRAVTIPSPAASVLSSCLTCQCRFFLPGEKMKSVSTGTLPGDALFPFGRCLLRSLPLRGRGPQRLANITSSKTTTGVDVQPSDGEGEDTQQQALSTGVEVVLEDAAIPPEALIILSACVVGLLTGVGVVIFNNAVKLFPSSSPVAPFPFHLLFSYPCCLLVGFVSACSTRSACLTFNSIINFNLNSAS